MNEHYYDEMIKSITSVNDKSRNIPLKYTGLNKKGGSTLAYEFENTDTKERYYWKITPKEDRQEDEDEQQEAATDGVPLLRIYTVFHIDQCEGIKPRKNNDSPGKKLQPDEHAEQIVAEYIRRSGVKLHVRRSSQASYSPSLDTITVPALNQYTDVAEYYSTLFHEITHSTGHCTRLNRPMSTVMFGSDNYSKEELIAELGSAYLVNACGLETAGSFRNSAGYIQGWLRALRDDKRFLVSAASRAEKAVKLIGNNCT